MIELMDGFFIYTAMSPIFTSLRHHCGYHSKWGYHVKSDSKECPNCKTPLTKKVVLMHKLWEFNK